MSSLSTNYSYYSTLTTCDAFKFKKLFLVQFTSIPNKASALIKANLSTHWIYAYPTNVRN